MRFRLTQLSDSDIRTMRQVFNRRKKEEKAGAVIEKNPQVARMHCRRIKKATPIK